MDRSNGAAIPILAVQSRTARRHVFAIRTDEAFARWPRLPLANMRSFR